MKKIYPVRACELAKAIVERLIVNGEKAVYFAEHGEDGEGESWHGASIITDDKETLLLVRHMGGCGNAYYYTFSDNHIDRIREDKNAKSHITWEIARDMEDYIVTNDFEVDGNNEYVAWLECEE